MEFYACKICQNDRHFLNPTFFFYYSVALRHIESLQRTTEKKTTSENFLRNHFHSSFITFCKRWIPKKKCIRFAILWQSSTKRTENGNQNTFFIFIFFHIILLRMNLFSRFSYYFCRWLLLPSFYRSFAFHIRLNMRGSACAFTFYSMANAK